MDFVAYGAIQVTSIESIIKIQDFIEYKNMNLDKERGWVGGIF